MTAGAYYPAPSKPTRIIAPDGSALTGDVPFTAGNGQKITRQANGLLVAQAISTKPRSVDLFVPGNLAARILAVLNGIPNAVLSSIDAYFKTAPGAGTDVANFASIRCTGSPGGGGPVSFAFNAQQPEWHLDMATLSQILGTIENGANIAGTQIGIGNMVGTEFHPTANLTLGGLAIAAAHTGLGLTGTYRYGIAADFNAGSGFTRATTPWLTLADGSPAYVDVDGSVLVPQRAAAPFGNFRTTIPFPAALNLVNGTSYVFVAMRPSGAGGGGTGLAGCTVYDPDTGNIVKSGNVIIGGHASNNPQDADGWTDTPGTWGTTATATTSWITFLGAVLGTPLLMPVTVDLTVTGAPANPGADLIASLGF